MQTLIYIIAATLVVSSGSLIGIFTLALKKKLLNKILLLLVSLSAGTLIGGAFLHLLPEAAENLDPETLNLIVLFSFVLFLLIEKIFHWRHCHKENCNVHTFGYMNLLGDALHNFLDGLIIAATFLTDIRLGIATTIAVSMHEIPQEIGDFGVLIHSGFKKNKAILANFLVALTAVFGGVIGFFFAQQMGNTTTYLLPIAAGGFIYIAASDLLPEIRKEASIKKSAFSLAIFLSGIVIMYALKLLGIE